MEARRTINKLTGRSAGRLAGALGLVLALCLISGGVIPAYATEPPPEMPHQFYGTVSVDGDPVAEGTLVEAFVDDVKEAETTVDGVGRYGYNPIFRVPGTAGATVTFKVGGIEADEDATWVSGKVQKLNLTIHDETPPPVQYKLTISSTTGGSVTTPVEGVYTYYAGTVVNLLAEAEAGYQFAKWTASAGTFGDTSAAETTFTMPAQDVTVTAHFGVVYELTMAADPVAYGEAIDVAAKGAYPAGAEVSIKAEPAAGYGFVNWTANTTVTFGNANAEETTFTMPAQAVTVTAHFGVAYELAMAADPVGGGNVTDVGAKGAYAAGASVSIKAEPAAGYGFVNWTANTTVTFGNATAAETTFTMPAQAVTVTANFVEMLLLQVTTQAATDITSYSVILHMSYTVGNFSPVEVRFACKRFTDPIWFYTTWVSRTADGEYTEVLTALVSETEYEFKAQLKYGGTVIEGDSCYFTTAAGASTGLYDLLGYLGCFIATAAYGTPTAEQIDVLREFRDVVLLKSTVGSQFVVLYYQLSPPIADFIARSELLRTLVRELVVDPIVWIIEATGDMWRN